MSQIPNPVDCLSDCASSTGSNIPGPQGPAGASGTDGVNGQSAFTYLTSGFTMPAELANIVLDVVNSDWTTVGQILFVQNAGYFQVVAIPSGIQVTVKNLRDTANSAYLTNTTAGIAIPNSMTVVSAGLQGARGATGATGPQGNQGVAGTNGTNGSNGVPVFTTLTAGFTMPNQGADVTIDVQDASWMVLFSIVYLQNAGYFQVISHTANQATIRNISNATEYTTNAAPGTVFDYLRSLVSTGIQGPPGTSGNTSYVKVSNQLSQGTDGPAIVSGTWQTVPLNTKSFDTGSIATLSSNQITLPAGNYRVRGLSPVYKGGACCLRLNNITTGALIENKVERAGDVDVQVNCTIDTRITLPGTNTLEFQQYCGSAISGGLLGKAANILGVDEGYARFIFEKEL